MVELCMAEYAPDMASKWLTSSRSFVCSVRRGYIVWSYFAKTVVDLVELMTAE